MPPQEASKSIVQVGEGRGFVVEGADGVRYVVTAAHCLPFLPPPCSFSDNEECTFEVLGPLGTSPTVWALCLFVDPVSDIAVLGAPDSQDQFHKCKAYEDFVGMAMPLSLRWVQQPERGWIFTLDAERWFSCRVEAPRAIWIWEAAEPIRGGMSGSPIVGDDGSAIAVLCTSDGSGDDDVEDDREGGPNPGIRNLPGWFLDELTGQSAGPE